MTDRTSTSVRSIKRKAHWRGYKDARKGAEPKDCPFPQGSKERAGWMAGWKRFEDEVTQNTLSVRFGD